MMNIAFEPLCMDHQSAVMSIFNHYVETTTAAFPGKPLPEPLFAVFLKRAEGGYPAYALVDGDSGAVVGFCQLSAYNPFSSFAKTAEVTYFIAADYVGRGLGSKCLEKLTEEGKKMGVAHLVAEVSSENAESLRFHERHGFRRAGELAGVGEKLGRTFGVVYLQKDI